MATICFLCGLPSSGKTTLAKRLKKETGAIRLTLDERMIAKYDYSIHDDEYGRFSAQEKQLMWGEAQIFLDKGQDVILDWSLWSRTARLEWTQKVVSAGYDYKLFYLAVELDTLKRRLAARNAEVLATVHTISLDELVRFSQIFEPPAASENLNLEIVKQVPREA
ncbi:MAG: ATP-binding protein [Chloroflexota bacterium]